MLAELEPVFPWELADTWDRRIWRYCLICCSEEWTRRIYVSNYVGFEVHIFECSKCRHRTRHGKETV